MLSLLPAGLDGRENSFITIVDSSDGVSKVRLLLQ